jgi:hypothetical protein
MGYGWPDLGDSVLSQCDVDALALIFPGQLKALSLSLLARDRMSAPRNTSPRLAQ